MRFRFVVDQVVLLDVSILESIIEDEDEAQDDEDEAQLYALDQQP